MKDAEYLFSQTTRERKQLSRNAKYKKNGSKSRRCTLPSDNLTPAQLRRRNGTVLTYNLDQPHTLAELKEWPTDLRVEYMEKILNTYHPTAERLAAMLGCKASSIWYMMQQYFPTGTGSGRGTRDPELIRKWEEFMGITSTATTEPEPEPEPDPAPTPEPLAPEAPVVQHRAGSPIAYDSLSVTFTGNSYDLIEVLQRGPLHLTGADTYTFTITATRKTGDDV